MEAITLAQSIVANYGLTPLGITMYADPGGSTLERHNNFEVRRLEQISPDKTTFRELRDLTCSQAWDVHSLLMPILGWEHASERRTRISRLQRKPMADHRLSQGAVPPAAGFRPEH